MDKKARESMHLKEGVDNIRFLSSHLLLKNNRITNRSAKEDIRIIVAKQSEK